jgi:hypothetical protein
MSHHMKKFFNYFLLSILLVLSALILILRTKGSYPTQVSGVAVYVMLALNCGWIFWNFARPLQRVEQTKTEKS